MLLLGWLGVIIIVLFFVLRAPPWLARGYHYCFVFVYVPPLGWLVVIIIVWFFILRATPWLARGYVYCFVFCLHATPWLARGYYYRFLVVIECVSNFWCVCVYFLRGGVRFPNEVGVW